jgi:hypothetical protein
MQTALQELISELKSIESYDPIVYGIIKRAESKLEKEKEQIINAYENGSDVNDDLKPLYGTPKEYYNQTYEKK